MKKDFKNYTLKKHQSGSNALHRYVQRREYQSSFI